MTDPSTQPTASSDQKCFSEAPPRILGFLAYGSALLLLGLILSRVASDLKTTGDAVLLVCGVLAVGVGVWCLLSSGYRRIRPSPRIVMDTVGFLDADRLGVVIPWADIATMTRTEAHGQEQLEIRLRDQDAYLAKLSPWRRARTKLDLRLGFLAVYVESNPWARQDFDRIVSFALLYHSRYGASQSC